MALCKRSTLRERKKSTQASISRLGHILICPIISLKTTRFKQKPRFLSVSYFGRSIRSPTLRAFISGGVKLAVIQASTNDIDMLARLIRAEAEGEGEEGMLMAGNVMVNRVRVDCLDFSNVRTIPQMAFQSPGGFEAVQKSYFYQRARERERRLARRLVNGERTHPASFSLWFFRPEGACPAQWWGQWNAGRFKNHCFYQPLEAECAEVFSTF